MGHQTAQWAILGRPKSCGWADWPSWANWAITGPTPMDALVVGMLVDVHCLV